MNVAEVKERARRWVDVHRAEWTGLEAAHLVGGIAAMPDDADYSATSDVDVHLIFANDSPMLIPTSPFGTILAEEFEGILIEAGPKPVAEYASAEAVLANPEIAQHMLYPSTLYDPTGMLDRLRPAVQDGFARRQWVEARIAHERAGIEGALGMMPFAREHFGGAGVLNILGYSCTFMTAALQLAALEPLRMGGRSMQRLGEALVRCGQPDLYEDALAMLGARDVDRPFVEGTLEAAIEAFDTAIPIHRTRVPFDHKLHAHLRPHFVETCRAMIAEGNHREAFSWIEPFMLCATSIIMADGSDEQRAIFGPRLGQFLAQAGFGSEAECDARIEQGARVRSGVFALIDEILVTNPRITD
jgi:hypothetical protein